MLFVVSRPLASPIKHRCAVNKAFVSVSRRKHVMSTAVHWTETFGPLPTAIGIATIDALLAVRWSDQHEVRCELPDKIISLYLQHPECHAFHYHHVAFVSLWQTASITISSFEPPRRHIPEWRQECDRFFVGWCLSWKLNDVADKTYLLWSAGFEVYTALRSPYSAGNLTYSDVSKHRSTAILKGHCLKSSPNLK